MDGPAVVAGYIGPWITAEEPGLVQSLSEGRIEKVGSEGGELAS